MSASPPVLEARGLCKAWPGVQALQDVSLPVHAGRVLALVGENGAGKSTLMNAFAGVVIPDRGQLLLDGQPIHLRHPADAHRHGIATIFQELSLNTNLGVADNLFLGRELRTRFGLSDARRQQTRARELLQRVGLEVRPATMLGELRVGQQQLVEIARALSLDARVLIMDEPTSALSAPETERLLGLVAELKRQGVAIVYITHRFEELIGIGDDIAVMRDGRLVAQAPFAGLDRAEIVRMMVGRDTGSGRARRADGASGAGDLFEVRGASLRGASAGSYLVRDVDLTVRAGEVLGIFGLMGAGRTELLETLFGVHGGRGQAGMRLGGVELQVRCPADARAAGLVLAPEDRKELGLVLGMSVRENASLASLPAVTRHGVIAARRETDMVRPLLERLKLKAPSLESPVVQLSGGNQQKVVLAKWLATRPRVLLLDEPTRGIDVNAKAEIYQLIDELAADGLAVVVASSELPELLAISDRIMVMCEGRKTAEFPWQEASAEGLLHSALPAAARAVSA